LAHATVIGDPGIPGASEREHLPGVAILVVIAVPLIVLAPAKQPIERLSVRAA